jgi:hypothetical protein
MKEKVPPRCTERVDDRAEATLLKLDGRGEQATQQLGSSTVLGPQKDKK